MILGLKNDNNDVRMLNIPLKLIILLAASFAEGERNQSEVATVSKPREINSMLFLKYQNSEIRRFQPVKGKSTSTRAMLVIFLIT